MLADPTGAFTKVTLAFEVPSSMGHFQNFYADQCTAHIIDLDALKSGNITGLSGILLKNAVPNVQCCFRYYTNLFFSIKAVDLFLNNDHLFQVLGNLRSQR